eukprot:2936343-Pyramimonas_sp.AAC.1
MPLALLLLLKLAPIGRAMQRLPAGEHAGEPRQQRPRLGAGSNGNGEQGNIREELRAVQRLTMSLDFQ